MEGKQSERKLVNYYYAKTPNNIISAWVMAEFQLHLTEYYAKSWKNKYKCEIKILDQKYPK